MNASPHCSGSVPSSGVEDNNFGSRSSAPKDNKLLSKDNMGNKSLIESYAKSSSANPGVDKGFLGKAKNEMTKSLHSL